MELSGASYLYALATVSVTFVGFSSLLLVFRQTKGSGLTAYDTYFTLSFMQAGFIATAGALIPPALALYDWPHALVWRVSSAAVAIPIFWFTFTVPGRRRKATGKPTPMFIRVLLTVQSLLGVALVLAAVGVIRDEAGAVYASAVTGMLLSTAIAYLLALGASLSALHEPPE